MVYPRIAKDQVVIPSGTPDRTLFVCVTKTYGVHLPENQMRCASPEDCSRGYWKNCHVTAAHAEDCDWLFAHKNRRIVEVFRIDRKKGWVDSRQSPKKSWPSDKPPVGTRKACEVTHDAAMTSRFKGAIVRLGRCQNPLRGYFVD